MERYNAKPIHLYIYALPLLVAGSVLVAYDWLGLGLTIFLMGIGTAIWTFVAGLTEQAVYYHDHLPEPVALLPIDTGAKWLKEPEPPAGLLSASLFQPPVTGPRLTQFIDAILQGKGLAETDWSPIKKGRLFSSIEIRELKGELRKHNLIKAVNSKNHLLGDELTPKGHRELLSYASPGVRQLLESRDYIPATSPALLRGGETPTLE